MAGEAILIIEDDVGIGALVEQVLREAGYVPRWVRSVDEARSAAVAGAAPGAIVSDLLVPGSAGPALLAGEIGALFPAAPLALITGVPPKRRAAMGVAHHLVLEKPFELRALLACVEAMLAPPGRAAGVTPR